MIKTDYHIHGPFSYDSQIAYNQLIIKAIESGYSSIAFTEHLDLLPQELGIFGLPPIKQYIDQLAKLKSEHQNIEILCGLEIGDYHRVKLFANSLIEMFPVDIILGSVHFLSDHTNVAVQLAAKLSISQLQDYYLQNLLLVSECNIDILAHLGVYARYYKNYTLEPELLPIIKEIFNVMIDKGIALEINYSAYRKNLNALLPSVDLIEMYYLQGGRLISIGSDSHHINHFNDYYYKLSDLMNLDKFKLFHPTVSQYS